MWLVWFFITFIIKLKQVNWFCNSFFLLLESSVCFNVAVFWNRMFFLFGFNSNIIGLVWNSLPVAFFAKWRNLAVFSVLLLQYSLVFSSIYHVFAYFKAQEWSSKPAGFIMFGPCFTRVKKYLTLCQLFHGWLEVQES